MRDDGEFFKSTRDLAQVFLQFYFKNSVLIPLFKQFCCQHFDEKFCCTREERDRKENLEVQENLILLRQEHFGTHSEVLIDYGPFMF